MDQIVRLDISDGVATITLDSPANRNALSRQLVTECHDALDTIDEHSAETPHQIRAIVLTHTPPAFCAGADLKETGTSTPDPQPMVRLMTRLMDAPQPTIAAVGGPVRAGGIGLMASCDLAVVRDHVTFALTEVRIGVVAAIISVPILRRADPSKLAAAFLTGEPFSPHDARQAGLITHVAASDDELHETVAALCEGIKKGAPTAVVETKRLLREVPGTPRDEAFAAMVALTSKMFASDDAAEGIAAFAEKRPPRWQLDPAPSSRWL